MKCVEVWSDYQYRPDRRWSVMFKAGTTYRNVIEAAAAAIVKAKAGRVLEGPPQPTDVDCWNVWQR